MTTRRHAFPRHAQPPIRGGVDDPNWQEIQRFTRRSNDFPFCLGATGVPAGAVALGAPGGYQDVNWTAPTNPLYNAWNIIDQSGTNPTWIRCPADGIYTMHVLWSSDQNLAEPHNIEMQIVEAPTGDSGFGAPVFAGISPGVNFFAYLDTVTIRWYITSIFRGIIGTENNLWKLRIRQESTVALNVGNPNLEILNSYIAFDAPNPKGST